MKKTLFRHNIQSYLKCVALGIVAGLLVAFFSRFPGDDLWTFALFSSQTFGFWICTCSLIALSSEKNYVAGINVGLYVYLMFYVTGIFKRLATVTKGYNSMTYFYHGFWQELAYGLIPAAICFILAFVLWYGRKDKTVFIILRFAPALCIFSEAVSAWLVVATRGQNLFIALVDTVCTVVYLLIILQTSDFRKMRTNSSLPG